MARSVRVVIVGSEAVLGEASGRAAELIALALVHGAALNRPGVRKIILNDTPAGLKLLLAYRPGVVPDCGGEESA